MSVYELPWSILSTLSDGVITVSEEEIISAMKLVSETDSKLEGKSPVISFH